MPLDQPIANGTPRLGIIAAPTPLSTWNLEDLGRERTVKTCHEPQSRCLE